MPSPYLFSLALDRDQLKSKIPVKQDSSTIRNSEEAKTLSSELESFEKLKNQVVDIVSKIFQTLNEDNIIPQMLMVLAKKTTEGGVFNENKAKYEEMIRELETLQGAIGECKNKMVPNNEAFLKVKSQASKPNEANEKVMVMFI